MNVCGPDAQGPHRDPRSGDRAWGIGQERDPGLQDDPEHRRPQDDRVQDLLPSQRPRDGDIEQHPDHAGQGARYGFLESRNAAAGGEKARQPDDHRPQLHWDLPEVGNRGPGGYHECQAQCTGSDRVHQPPSSGARTRYSAAAVRPFIELNAG